MANINKDFLIIANLKNLSVKTSTTMVGYNIDKRTFNMFVKLQIPMSEDSNIYQYVGLEEASDYSVKLNVVKPNKMYRERTGVLMSTGVDGDEAVYQFDLPSEFTDMVGTYKCELNVICTVNGLEEIMTTSSFGYEIKPSIATGLNGEIVSDPDYPVLKELIDEVKGIAMGSSGIDDTVTSDITTNSSVYIANNYQKIRDNSLDTTNKTVVGAINELDSEIININNTINNLSFTEIDDTIISDDTTNSSSYISTTYQKIEDYMLNTNDKTIVGAINELDLKIKDAIDSIITSTARNLLVTILRNGTYSIDQSDNIDALENALANTGGSGTVQYTITNKLTNAKSSNTSTLVDANSSYTATITADSGYALDTVTVSMGGTDITSSVYSNGTITISSITGNVLITVTTKSTTFTYTITNNLTNATNSNSATTINSNSTYTATITPNTGYALDTVTVTMNGVDITNTAYSSGNISITTITGNIVITVTTISIPTENPLTNLVVDIQSSDYYLDDLDSLYKIHNNVNDETVTVLDTQRNFNPFWTFTDGAMSTYGLSTTGTTFQSLTGAMTFMIDCDVNSKSTIGQTGRLNGMAIFQNVFNSTWDNYNSQSISLPYINTSGTSATYATDTYSVIHTLPSNWSRYIMTIVLEEDGQINTYLDNQLSATIPAPSDFASWDYATMVSNWSKLQLIAHKVDGLIGYDADVNFIVRNSSTSISELESYNTYVAGKNISLTNDISSLSLEEGDSFFIGTSVSPTYFKDSVSISYTSEDESIITLNGDMAYASKNGQTNVISSATYNDKNLELKIPITVEDISYTPTPVRTANRIKVQYVPSTMYVGEEYSIYAIILNEITDSKKTPYEYSDDNLVSYKSNNPTICRVKNGVLKAISPGTAEIIVSDINNTVSTTINVTVEEPVVTTITDNETYSITLPCTTTNGVLHTDNTSAEETTKAIQDLLEYCTTNNKKKIVFPAGEYLISPAYGSITIPNNLVIDFVGSNINIEESSLTSSGYNMIIFEDTENSKIINANIYGERFTMSLTSGAEGCQSILFRGNCYNSGLENCTISQSPGFNIGATQKNLIRHGLLLSNIESGKLNDDGSVSDETVDYCYRSIDFISIPSLKEKFGFGNRQGYEGYLYLSARVYDVYFYDSNKNFISSIKDCLQFFIYDKPEGAMYAKIVFYQTYMPTSCDGDFNSVAMLYSHDVPDKCFIRNCVLEDNYSTAIQPNGGDNWVIENNIFRRNGYRDPSSHIDWEDGRNNIHGHITRNNIFEDGGTVTFIGGSCMVFHNNTLINCSLNHDSEVQNSRIYLNHFKGSKTSSIKTKTDMAFSQNYFGDGATYTVTNTSDVNFIVHDFNNVIN